METHETKEREEELTPQQQIEKLIQTGQIESYERALELIEGLDDEEEKTAQLDKVSRYLIAALEKERSESSLEYALILTDNVQDQNTRILLQKSIATPLTLVYDELGTEEAAAKKARVLTTYFDKPATEAA